MNQRPNDFDDQLTGLALFLYNEHGGRHKALHLDEAAQLTWASIPMCDSRVIRLKTQRLGVVEIPLHPAFEEWLRIGPRGLGSQHVFPMLQRRNKLQRCVIALLVRQLHSDYAPTL